MTISNILLKPQSEQDTTSIEHEESKYHTVFWDIDAVSNVLIWMEPITQLTEHTFSKFNPAADKDILVPLDAIDGVIPGSIKHECD